MLTLGRQGVLASFDESCQIVCEEGIVPQMPSDREKERTNIPAWIGTVHEDRISDVAFFRLLGVAECYAIDFSAHEKADYQWDLNLPVPEAFRERFDLIVDAGTMEHVFDVRQVLTNLATMLRYSGRVIHVSPCNNSVDHGFYQFSPTLFHDYYQANRFKDLRVYLAEDVYGGNYSTRVRLFHYTPGEFGVGLRCSLRRRLTVYCIAERTPESHLDRIPTQTIYQSFSLGGPGNAATSSEVESKGRIPTLWFNRLAHRLIPRSVYRTLRVYWIAFRRKFLDKDLSRRPWGLRIWRNFD